MTSKHTRLPSWLPGTLLSTLALLVPLSTLSSSHNRPVERVDGEVPLLMPGTKMPFKMWETQQVAENVYAFRHTFYRSIFIVTDEGVIAADPLNAVAGPIMLEEIRKITDLPVKVHLDLTWRRRDRSPLLAQFVHTFADVARAENPGGRG